MARPLCTLRLLRRMMKFGKFQFLFPLACLLFVVFVCKQVLDEQELARGSQFQFHLSNTSTTTTHNTDNRLVFFRHDVPLIWIGGVPRSGTTLMRVMLDAHPDIRCGTETRVIPRILNMYQNMERVNNEMTWLHEAQLTNEILEAALGAYILSIITLHGDPAARLCNKDPFALRYMPRLLRIFPDSRFLLMVRDGRATVHSIISRNVTIKGFDFKTYRGALTDWNRAMSTMYAHCLTVGPDRCLPVYYEQLVLHPEQQMRQVLEFLRVSWNDVVLRHESAIGIETILSKKEYSSAQVSRAVNTESLYTWVEHIPDEVRSDMRSLAPMLQLLGYDPDAYPPDYTNQYFQPPAVHLDT